MADKESVRQQLYEMLEKNLNSNQPVSSGELKTLSEAFATVSDTERPLQGGVIKM